MCGVSWRTKVTYPNINTTTYKAHLTRGTQPWHEAPSGWGCPVGTTAPLPMIIHFFFFPVAFLATICYLLPPPFTAAQHPSGQLCKRKHKVQTFFFYFRYFSFYTEDYCISSIGAHNLQQDEQAEKSAPCRWRSPNLLLGEKMRRLIGPGLSRPITCQPHFIPQLRQTSLFRTSPPLIGICLTNTEAYGNFTTRVVHNWLEGHNHENTHRLSRIARSV